MLAIPPMHLPVALGAPGQSRGTWPGLQHHPENASPIQWSFLQQQQQHAASRQASPLLVCGQPQQQRPLHLDATPLLVTGSISPPVDDEESRRRRRSRTPLQAAPSAMRHVSPYGIRGTSPASRCASPTAIAATSSIPRHASPHGQRHASPLGLRQLPQQVAVQPQVSILPQTGQQPVRLLRAEIPLPDHSQSQSSHPEQVRDAAASGNIRGGASMELEPGSTVRIGDCECLITSPLGMGSFGVVWAAECAGVGNVAVKEIICSSEIDLSRAVYEAQLLWMLSNNSEPTSLQNDSRIPAYVASDMCQTGSDVCRVRLAMGRVPGEPLDKFLREYRQHLDLELAALKDDIQAAEEMRQATQACRFAHMLVLQLPPIMERISALAYHRDVNAHNILIAVTESSSGASDPCYGLVDFGLAVDAAKWRDNEQSPGDWRHFDVGGDCRYWPASAWLQFQVGCYELSENSAFCHEYQTHLDLQGLGITALQVLVELLPPPPVNIGDGKQSKLEQEFIDKHPLGELWKLYICWHEYWVAATNFWTALLETFRNNGDWNSLKMKFIEIEVHRVIATKLQAVRTALSNVEEACRRSVRGTCLHGAQDLFAALLVLISCGEERTHTTTWNEVLERLGGLKSEGSARSSPVVSPSIARQREAELDSSQSFASSQTKSPKSTELSVPQRLVQRPRSSSPTSQALQNSHRRASPARHKAQPKLEQPIDKIWLPPPTHSTHRAEEFAETSNSATGGLASSNRDASGSHIDESHDLFFKLSNLATRVVQLAKAMEKLELRDRDIAAITTESTLRP